MIVTCTSVRRESVEVVDIAPGCTRVGWADSGGLEVEFAGDLTVQQQWLVRLRVGTATPADEQATIAAVTAWLANNAYLAIPTPTGAQAAAQVAALTRQMQGVIQLLLPVDAATIQGQAS